MYQGIGVSPGIAIGKAYLFKRQDLKIKRKRIRSDQIQSEILRFRSAVKKAREELRSIKSSLAATIGEEKSRLLDPQLLILWDNEVLQETNLRIRGQRKSAEFAFQESFQKILDSMESIEDPYLRERSADIRDVAQRILRHLLSEPPRKFPELLAGTILIAHDLSPSDAAQLRKERISGVTIETGGRTSHTAIMTRSLEIPAVVGVKQITSQVRNGDLVILDGNKGLVFIKPDERTLERYERERDRYTAFLVELQELKDLPALTPDGHLVQLSANIELPEELDSVLLHGAKGIGLFRTEFLYLTKHILPSEEEQYKIYRTVAEKIHPDPVIIRTFDLGGDKVIPPPDGIKEINPFLGWRGIRFSLARLDIFKTQLRAILRASVVGNIKVMFPLIASLDEFRQSKQIFRNVERELKKEGILFNRNCELGVMIETPSAALISDLLAREVDFFSIGSNDLTQYTMAVDRANARISYLFDPLHPAILRLIKQVVETAHKRKIWVGLCGEMSADPLAIPLLIGLGLDELSMSPVALPEVKKIIRGIKIEDAKKMVRKALQFKTPFEIRNFLKKEIKSKFPQFRKSYKP